MDQTKFAKFLSLARSNLEYKVIGTGPNNDLMSSTKTTGNFEQGSLTYFDTYSGFEKFFGKESLSHKGKVVWRRFYTGEITDKTLTREEMENVFSFLKDALSRFPNSKPEQRGPQNFEKGLFEYKNTCTGNFEKFQGKEEIFWKGKKVYELTYHN